MGDIVNGDKIVFGNNSRMIKIELKNYYSSNPEEENDNVNSGIVDAEEAEFEEVNEAKNSRHHADIRNHLSVKEQNDDVESKEESTISSLIEKLKPIFYNNEENVRLFLKEINGMKDKYITDLVNKWVKDKLISDYGNSRKGDLWTILKDAKLYTKTRQNWCRRVY